jgi:GTP-binding protein
VGRIGVGRIHNGRIRSGQEVKVCRRDGRQMDSRVQQVQVFDGLGRKTVEQAEAGDIVALVGLESVEIGDSICDPLDPRPLEAQEIEPPTLTMMFGVNDSPLAGREGKHVTSRKIHDRLWKELESNVALRVEESANKDAFKVCGRGLLHLGILIENMRREGYELSVGKPHVILRAGSDGRTLEPIEYLVIDVPEKHMGGVMELVGNRRGELKRMDKRSGQVHVEFTIPSRGLIGLRTRLLTATQGLGIMHHNFHEYAPMRGDVPARSNGVMISKCAGTVNAYALNDLQDRGAMFVEPGEACYEGQIVGDYCREKDIVVNPTRAKRLSNIRTTASDENIILKPARKMTLEEALEYIEEDEVVEVTPEHIRLRKDLLTENERKRAGRKQAEALEV